MLTSFLLCVLALFGIYKLINKILNPYGIKAPTAPGPPTVPILGNFLQVTGDKPPFELLEKLKKQFGDVIALKIGYNYRIVFNGEETIKEVMNNDLWVDRFFDDFFAARSFGKPLGVVFNSGDNWREMRHFCLKTLRDFGFGRNRTMEGVIEEELLVTLASIDAKLSDGNNIMSTRNYFNVSVINILWELIAGTRFDHEDSNLKEMIAGIFVTSKGSIVGGIYDNITYGFPFLKGLVNWYTNRTELYRKYNIRMHGYFRSVMEQKREEGTYREDPKDFIDAFLKAIDDEEESGTFPRYYTEEQFVVVCFDLFIAGSENTANTLEFSIIYMILNQPVQKKVQEELDRVLQGKLPNISHKPMLPYTTATLLETQRMANINPGMRRSPTEDTTVNGYFIPKGTPAVMNVWGVHMDEKSWGDPKVFRPERFLDEKGNIINSQKIIPFGHGKRLCLGENLAKGTFFTFFSAMLQKYTFDIAPGHPVPVSDPDVGFSCTPHKYVTLINLRH